MADFPKTVKDSLGREWTVDVTLASAQRVKDRTGLGLNDLIPRPKTDATADDVKPFQAFVSDVFRLFDVFYALIQPQADAKQLSKEQVLEGIASADVENAMTYAVLQGIADFFQRRDPPRAQMVRQFLKIGHQTMTKAAERMERELDKIDLDKFVDELPVPNVEDLTSAAIAQSKKSAGS